MSPIQIGNIFFYELGVMSLATIPALLWQRFWSFRLATAIFVVIFIIGNLLSFFANNIEFLIISRVISAFGAGGLMIVTISCAAQTSNPERVYGFWLVGQTLLGAIGILTLPVLFSINGIKACYLTLSIMMLIASPLFRYFPTTIIKRDIVDTPKIPLVKMAIGILVVLIFYIAISSIWTFIAGIAAEAKFVENDVAKILSVATLMGIVGSTAAAIIGNRSKRILMLTLGYFILLLAIALLYGKVSLINYIVAALAFKFTWTFVLPYILATLAQLDASGRLMNIINLVIGGGLAIGPAIAGRLIEADNGFNTVIMLAIVCALLSYVLIIILNINLSTSLLDNKGDKENV